MTIKITNENLLTIEQVKELKEQLAYSPEKFQEVEIIALYNEKEVFAHACEVYEFDHYTINNLDVYINVKEFVENFVSNHDDEFLVLSTKEIVYFYGN